MADAKFKELFDFFHNPGEKTVNVHAAAPRDGKTVWIFGRGADCDFVYSTPKVSRVHCKIEYIDSHYYLTDFNSSNIPASFPSNFSRVSGFNFTPYPA